MAPSPQVLVPPPAAPETQAPIPQEAIPPVQVPLVRNLPPTKSGKSSLPLLGVLVLVTIGIGGFLLWKFLSPQKSPPVAIPTPTPTEVPTATPTPDPTADWQVYTNQKYGFSLKYPPDFVPKEFSVTVNASKLLTVVQFSMSGSADGEIISVELGKTPMTPEELVNNKDFCPSVSGSGKSCSAVRPGPVTGSIQFDVLNQRVASIDTLVKDNDLLADVTLAARKPNVPIGDDMKQLYDQTLSTFKFLDKPSPTTSTQINGADLKNIKYKLSQGWEAKLNNDSLFISPVNGGGYLSIRVYDYSGSVGRREYYCQVSKVCIEGTSYFTEMNIGNISGYVANALDNSGGGAEYFGVKGNKFYVISSYSPPSPSEFEQNYKNVLNSFVF